MARKPIYLEVGEYYHVYNRGVEKRDIVTDALDSHRFLRGLSEFNTEEPIGSLYENSFNKKEKVSMGRDALVEIVAYCLNPNHYHLLLKQIAVGGISEFMKRVGGGYASYFNSRHERSGTLFQGRYKVRHVKSNEYLLHLSAYINLNDRVHQLGGQTPKLVRSSWGEYVDKADELCRKDIILDQFKSVAGYKKYAEDSLKYILKKKEDDKELRNLFHE